MVFSGRPKARSGPAGGATAIDRRIDSGGAAIRQAGTADQFVPNFVAAFRLESHVQRYFLGESAAAAEASRWRVPAPEALSASQARRMACHNARSNGSSSSSKPYCHFRNDASAKDSSVLRNLMLIAPPSEHCATQIRPTPAG